MTLGRVVIGETDGMLVYTVMFHTFIHGGPLLTLGRGRWRSVWPGGDFCCDLSFHPSRSYVDYGAYTSVMGESGRWQLGHSASTLYLALRNNPSVASTNIGAKENRGEY